MADTRGTWLHATNIRNTCVTRTSQVKTHLDRDSMHDIQKETLKPERKHKGQHTRKNK